MSFLPPDHPDLEKLLPLIVESYEEEFLISPFTKLSSAFTATLVWHGFLPMAVNLGRNGHYMLPKIHHERSLLVPSEVHVGRQTRKRAKLYRLSVDKAWAQVVDGVQKYTWTETPGDNWLCDELVSAYHGVQALSSKQRRGVTFHSVELWHLESGTLVAGEIGYTVGKVYTSCTGFCLKSGYTGSGTVQLVCLGRWLAKLGFELWDLGMEMEYKKELGSKNFPRKEWIRRLKLLRDSKCELRTPDDNDPTAQELLAVSADTCAMKGEPASAAASASKKVFEGEGEEKDNDKCKAQNSDKNKNKEKKKKFEENRQKEEKDTDTMLD